MSATERPCATKGCKGGEYKFGLCFTCLQKKYEKENYWKILEGIAAKMGRKG